jgi:hypothetical protein
MQDDGFYDDIERQESFTERYLGLSLGKFLIALFAVLGLGIYIGILLFGDNSLEILLGLEEYESYLHEQIETLKSDNAQLQKEYFELKELERESEPE